MTIKLRDCGRRAFMTDSIAKSIMIDHADCLALLCPAKRQARDRPIRSMLRVKGLLQGRSLAGIGA